MALPASREPPALRATPFVGRDPELALLRTSFERVVGGRGQVVLLVGEPGIGKTRLADEWAQVAQAHGAQVLWGQAYEWDGAPPFWPWIQVLRAAQAARPSRWLAELGGEYALALAELLPELREQLPAHARASWQELEPERGRFQLFAGVADALKLFARAQPLVLVLDDLHWADAPSLLLLQFLAQELRESSVLLLGTCRHVELGQNHPLAATLAELSRSGLVERVELRGLPRPDIARYLDLMRGRAATPAFAEAIYQRTDGNPFFVAEVVRLLAHDDPLALSLGKQAWQARIPDSVKEVIGKRLSRLRPTCNELLAVAAVIGREFSLPLLEHVTDLPPADLLDELDSAARARVIESGAGLGRYRFSHALIQETLYQGLSSVRQAQVHRRVGETLERLYAHDLTSHFDELARHFFQALALGVADKAVEYARKAGERAIRQVAWETAVEHYERALQASELLDVPDRLQQCELLLALGDVADITGVSERSESATIAFERAAELARGLGSAELLARAALSSSGVDTESTINGVTSVGLLEEALAALGSEDSPLRARVLARLGTDSWTTSTRTQAQIRALSDEAVAMARRLGDADALRFALTHRQSPLWSPDNLDERLAESAELVANDDASWHFIFGPMAVTLRWFWLMEAGDIAASDVMLRRQMAYAAQSRITDTAWMAAELRAMEALQAGRLDEADEQLRHATQLWPENLLHTAQLMLLRREQERLAELRGASWQRYHEYMQFAKSARRDTSVFEQTQAMWLDLQTGYVAEARHAFEILAADDFGILRDAHYFWFGMLAMLSEACATFDDRARATALYARLLPYGVRNLYGGAAGMFMGSGWHYLGLLATTLQRWDTAAAHFERALTFHQRIGARPLLARTQLAYARLLLGRERPGDMERARALLDAAQVAARELDLRQVARLTDELTPRPGPGAVDAVETSHGLSPRELEVLRLVVEGNSNQEIAAELGIAPRTVANHVASMMNKLGLESRTAVATWAVRRGLG